MNELVYRVAVMALGIGLGAGDMAAGQVKTTVPDLVPGARPALTGVGALVSRSAAAAACRHKAAAWRVRKPGRRFFAGRTLIPVLRTMSPV